MPVDAPEAGPSRSIPIDWQEAAGTEASGDSEPFHSNIFPHSDQKLRWERRATPDSSLNPSRQARVDLLFWRAHRSMPAEQLPAAAGAWTYLRDPGGWLVSAVPDGARPALRVGAVGGGAAHLAGYAWRVDGQSLAMASDAPLARPIPVADTD
eukprot:ctg_883.g411